MKVLFVASEALPFCKTGGLADVAGSLPQALGTCDIDARLILPRYDALKTGNLEIQTLGSLSIPFDGVLQRATLQRAFSPEKPEQSTYFIDAPQYFARPNLYGYEDDLLRFGFFCRAVLEALPIITARDNWRPDILHCHDWHTGLLAAYKSTLSSDLSPDFKTIFTIHNLVYQGLTDKSFLPRLGFDWSLFNYHQLEFFGKINALKSGLVFSDAITTVSPTYAREIQTHEQGAGLDGVLAEHAHQLSGIINGIDYREWNPQSDSYLAANFSLEDLAGKAICKADLQKQVGLPVDGSTPIVGIVSRLSSQKGFDLIASGMEKLLASHCQLVVLGAGDEYYMKLFEKLGARFKGRATFELGAYNEALAHKIYAGSDLFLMPSQYEPCGLSQMISLAYGTIPIVRATGGLADTIQQFDAQTETGNGFVFREYNTAAMLDSIQKAIKCFHSPHWPRLIQNAFQCDFSWDASAREYSELYCGLVKS